MKNFAKNTLFFLLIFAVFCIASCSGLIDVEAPEIAAESGTTNISTGGGTSENAPTVVPIVDGKLCVAIELGLSANKNVARSAMPSGFDGNLVYAATIFHAASYEPLKICEYNYDSATNQATLEIPFTFSKTARENYDLNICAFPAGTDLDSFASVADAILNSALHGTTTISTAANSISATLGDSVVKLLPKSGNGTVELKITLPSADYTLSCSDTRFSCSATTSEGVATITATIASGSYPVTLQVLKGSDIVYTRNETINVFPAMKTDVWLSGDGASTQKLTITLTEINSTFYVAGSGSTWFTVFGSLAGDDDSGNGSIAKPFATIQKAIKKIKAITTSDTDSFTIYVDGTFTASDSTPVADFSEIQSGCSITLKGLDATSKATLDGNKTARVIVAGTNAASLNLNLTLDNLTITQGRYNTASGRAGGISICSTGGNTYKIQNCEITKCAAAYGAGIYHENGNLSFTNCKISGNTATTSGGGVYSGGSADTTVTFSNTNIEGNTASNGGGIFIGGGSKATISDETVTIKSNVATRDSSSGTGGQGICVWHGTLELKDGAKIDSSNNIRLMGDQSDTDPHLKITGDLTETGIVATIYPTKCESGIVVLEATTADLIASSVEKFSLPSTATNYVIVQDDTDSTTMVNAVIVDNTPRETVYLYAAGGKDIKDGSTKANAVRTLTRATKILDYTAANPKIIIISPYTLANTETGLLDFSTKVASPKVVTIERYYSSSSDYCSGTVLTVSSDSTVAIKNVTFDGNWKASDGTTVKLADAGGSLLSVSSRATVTLGANCAIKNNSRTGESNGGGVYNIGTLNISGGTISGNNAKFGGGIYSRGTVQIESGTISNNNANHSGGGICIDAGSTTISGGEIKNNTAPNYGGGIFNCGTVTIESGTISGNKAYRGGGIHIYTDQNVTGKAIISGGTISGNTASGNGANGAGINNDGILNFSGAAAVNANNDVYLNTGKFITITGDLTKTAPVATITPASYTTGTQVLDGTLVSGNYEKFAITPQSDGMEWGVNDEGNLFIKAIAEMYVNASNGDDANKGTSEKPLLTLQEAANRIAYTSKASTDSYTVNAIGTFTATDENPLVDFSKVKSGCSVTLKGPSAASKATIDGNTTAQGIKVGEYDGTTKTPANLNLTLENMVITSCNAARGAGILLVSEDTNSHTFTNCEITNSTATHAGGIYNIAGTLTLSNVTISGNAATSNGGGIYNYLGTVILSSGTIGGNTANNGGGIYNNSGPLTINGGTIGKELATAVASSSNYSNKASNAGGGIYNSNGTLTLSKGNIYYNYAGYGGGIYNDNSTNSIVNMGPSCTTIIKYNYCGTSGGGIYTARTFTMQGGTISNNNGNNGGGIFTYNDSSITTISGGTISNNTARRTASNGGHGICVWRGTLALEGGAQIDSNNNIRLMSADDTAPHLKITGNLTGTAPVAKIIPKSYTVGNTVLEGDADLIAANCNKLSFVDSTYYISSTGKIAKY